MAQIFTYSNGFRVIVETMSSARTVASGLWVGAGCSHEDKTTNGISHFIEHMLFKGTAQRTSFEIADDFERLGASVNAFTGKECTCYYYKAVDEYNEKCFEIMADFFHNSAFEAEEMAKEKGVVTEEIGMVEDAPDELCFDLLAKSIYNDHPLGQTILGTVENIKGFSSEDLRGYMSRYYVPKNTVASFAGNITLEEAKRLCEKYLLGGFVDSQSQIEYPKLSPTKFNFLTREKDIEQGNLALRFPSYPLNSPLANEVSVLNFILGAGMSSRLFQAVRERLGLAYSIFSAPSAQKFNGSFIIFCNMNPQNLQKAAEAIVSEIKNLTKNGIGKSEFERAKTQIKSAFVFAQESAQSTMNAIGKFLLMTGETFDTNKKIAEINAVTEESVMNVARQMFDFSNVCGAYVGKKFGDVEAVLKS